MSLYFSLSFLIRLTTSVPNTRDALIYQRYHPGPRLWIAVMNFSEWVVGYLCGVHSLTWNQPTIASCIKNQIKTEQNTTKNCDEDS